MVNKQEPHYIFNVVDYEIIGGKYSVFLIKVLVQPFNITFHIKDRYSGLEDFQKDIKAMVELTSGLPTFPGKKLFGNLEKDFLKKRMKEIEMFLNMFLKHPEVVTNKAVAVYLNKQAVEDKDRQAVEDLVAQIEGKPKKTGAPQKAHQQENLNSPKLREESQAEN